MAGTETSVRFDQSKIASKYGDWAEGYDQARRGLFFDIAGEVISQMAGSCTNLAVLDVPVGTGRIMPFLLRNGALPESYDGVDVAPEMLEVAEKKACDLKIPKYSSTEASLWELPFPDNHFDLVLVLRLFHLFPSATYTEALAEVNRVLRPGGAVVAEMRNRYRGVIGGYLREWLDERNPNQLKHYYIRPRELEQAFHPMKIVESRGYWFDGTQVLKKLSRKAAYRINTGLSRTPLRYFASELAVKAVKV